MTPHEREAEARRLMAILAGMEQADVLLTENGS